MKLYPEGWIFQAKNEAERLLGLFLETNLPEEWAGFANYAFISADANRRSFGEWDFIILTPRANLFLVELKDNPKLYEEKGRLFAIYNTENKPKDVTKQLTENYATFLSNLKNTGLPQVRSRIIFISLRYSVSSSLTLPSSSIFDVNSEPSAFSAAVRSLLKIEADSHDSGFDIQTAKGRFFSTVGLIPSVDNISNQERSYVARENVSYKFLKNLSISHYRNSNVITVDAPPGSGKTQIGLAAIDDAIQNNQNVIYASHTRALAANIAEEFGQVDQVNHSVWRAKTGNSTTVLTGSIYGLEDFIRTSPNQGLFATIVIDEAHDIELQTINRFIQLTSSGSSSRYFLLSDRAQGIFFENLSRASSTDIFSATYFLHSTYRCSKKITELLNGLHLRDQPIDCQNNVEGDVRLLAYPHAEAAYAFIDQCIQDFCQKGAHPSQFAVLVPSAQHVESALSSFPGSCTADAEGWRDSIVVDSVIRFKGYARDCVFVPCFFSDRREMDDQSLRRLIYSCAGRAREIVVILTDLITRDRLAPFMPS